MLTTDEKIKCLERKLSEQSKSIDELTKHFEKLFSIKNKSKMSRRPSLFEVGITRNKGENVIYFKTFVLNFTYNFNNSDRL